jgi:hypothetical protein
MPLRTQLVRDLDAFAKLKQPWNELVTNTEVDHAYMRHEWFECWIKNLGRPRNLMIHTGWSEGQLAAIAPLQCGRQRFKGLPARTLSFLASGITPRCNFIVHESVKAQEFFEAIFRLPSYDLVYTMGMDADLCITHKYIEFLREHKTGKYAIEPGRRSPFLVTKTDWEEYRRLLPKQFRTNLNTGLNKLKRAADSYQVIKVTDYRGLADVFKQLVETSAKSWKGQTETDLKATPAQLSFFKEFSRKTSDQQLYEVWLLRIDDKLAAFEYYLKGNRKLSAIRTDFDMSFKRYSPGHSLKVFV